MAFALALPPAPARGDEEPARHTENPLTAPATPPEQAKPAGQLTKPPELLQFVEAAYPAEAQAARVSGSVGLLVDLDDKGTVTEVQVTEPAGNGFDDAAVEAVKKFKFSPAEIDGKPAPVRIAYHYNFTLQEQQGPPPLPKEAVVTLRGKVLQRGNREPLSAPTISVDEGAFGVTGSERGEFEVAGVPPGKHQVVVIAAGFDRFATEEEVVEGKVTEVTYYVHKHVFSPYETVVRGQRERKDVARVELRQEEIRLVAGTGGDAFRVVQDLPGVARAPYSFGLLIVRGGRPDDTRVYVDGVWIPIIFHFAGLVSVYNSDLLSSVTFQPGNFGAQNGRAVGGSVEAETRSPSKDAYHGYANISAIDTTLLAEGPIKGDWTFAAAGRISYVDLVLKAFLPSSVQFATAPRYWDYQAKAEWAPKGPDRVTLQFFGAHDLLKLLLTNPAMIDPEGRADVGMSEDFERLMGTWRHTFSPTVSNKLVLALGLDTGSSSVGADLKGTISLWAAQLRETVTWEPTQWLTLEVGTDSYLGWYSNDVTRPPLPLPGEVPDPIVSRQVVHGVDAGFVFEPALFAEATLRPFATTRIVPGIRGDYEGTLKYFTVDPRLAVFQQVVDGTVLKGAVGLYHQPPEFRLQQWTRTFGNPYLGAEQSLQAMIGLEQRIIEALSLDVQLYYKWMNNLEWPSAKTVLRDGQMVLERYNNSGQGRSYGVEVLLRHELSNSFFGWISYSFSKSQRRSTDWTTDDWRLAQFDQPHHLIVVASYKWPYDIVTGLRFQWASGNLYTPYPNRVYDSDADIYMPIPGQFWSQRGPDFISLDLRIDKRFVFKEWTINVFVDVQNVTNNKNPEFVLYNFDYTQTQYVRGMPIFPTIGLKAEF